MTTTTTRPVTTVIPDHYRPPCSRLAREARDLAWAAGTAVGVYVAYRVLSWATPWTIWWPLMSGTVVVVGLIAGTPDGGTTVRHGIRTAMNRPVVAALTALAVLAPWIVPHILGWVADAIAAGTRQAVTAVVAGIHGPSLPSVDVGGAVDKAKAAVGGLIGGKP